MDANLRRRLIELNRTFYAQAADRFADCRRQPWPGWERVLDAIEAAGMASRPRVMDVGCGHGRFAAFLVERGYDVDHLGIDTSLALLVRAGSRRLGGCRFACADLTTALAASAGFDLITAFGLLHHIPGRQQRRRLVADLCARLAPAGHLVITLWSPDARRRRRATPVDDGEPGDVFLPWGEDAGAKRYCHFFDDAEVDELVATLGSQTVRFRADGRGGENHYLIARR